MPDNIGYTPGVGATVAADEIGGVIFQRLKLVIGGDGVNGGDVAVGNPLPVVGAVTTDGVTDAELRASPVPVSAANLDVALSTRASEATLATRASEATLATRASEATLATRASEATLATRVADATITARLNILGQNTMAGSAPVVIASNQSAVPTAENSTSTLANGAQTAVGAAAVIVLAANAARKWAIIQNVGAQPIRVGVAGVTNTTGFRLVAGASATFTMPNIPTGAIYAIREGGASSTVLAQEGT